MSTGKLQAGILVGLCGISCLCMLSTWYSKMETESYTTEIAKCNAYLDSLALRQQAAAEMSKQCEENERRAAMQRRIESVGNEPKHFYFQYNGQVWDAETQAGKIMYGIAMRDQVIKARNQEFMARALVGSVQ